MDTPELDRARDPNRREFLALGVGAFLVAGLPFAARRTPRVIRRAHPVMGTIAEFAVVHGDARHAHAAIDAAMEELRHVERTMTRFTRTSDIGRANLAAPGVATLVSAETALVSAEALRWAAGTEGAFDPAVGRLVELWAVNTRHEPPPADAVTPLAHRRLFESIEADRVAKGAVLVRRDGDARLDLGAIGKGYAVDRAVEMLRRWGIRQAVVDVGGDLYALGDGPDGGGWRIGIQSPDDSQRMAAELQVSDAAVATSGTYVQGFRYRGHRYHHLMNPETGAPRETPVRSLTIRAATCMVADVAATALFGMTGAESRRRLDRLAPDAVVVRAM